MSVDPGPVTPIPALCPQCGNLFPGPIALGKGAVLNITGRNTVSPCPFCGGVAYMPEGVYQGLEGVVQILSGAQATVEALLCLRTILTGAREKRAQADEVAEKITADVPAFDGVGKYIRKNPTLLIAILALLLQVINTVLSRFPLSDKSAPSPTVTNEIVFEAFEQANFETAKRIAKQKPVKRADKKIGRNDPCSCGSGKKFNKCCGR